jgi:hypothetical protein
MSLYNKNLSLDPDLDEYLTEYKNQTPLESAGHYDGE